MKRILIIALTLGAALALPATTFAGKANKPGKGEGKGANPGRVLHGLDKNSNHQIDGDEVDALKKQFASCMRAEQLANRSLPDWAFFASRSAERPERTSQK